MPNSDPSSFIPERASAVVIGGGVIGASVAYHLARLGWSDVVLLERRRFGCGTSWHAAGLVGTVRASETHARLAAYSLALLSELEAETAQATGFRRVGSLTIAHSTGRFEELRRLAAMNNGWGTTRVELVTVEEMRSLYPLLETGGLLGGTWVERDGMASPVDILTAFVKGARGRGAICREGVEVVGIRRKDGRVAGVQTTAGDVAADFVVNCAGLWGREVGRLAGVNVPLQACEHYYAHTEKLDLPPDLPVLRDHDVGAYVREDAGSLLVGGFEPVARPWGVEGIPEGFEFGELPGEFDAQLMPVLGAAAARVPILAAAGWRRLFCGPESFTPDDQFHLGEAPELRGFFVACGMNSIGVQSAGGIGELLARWMAQGHPPADLVGNDIRRMHRFQGTRGYLAARVSETLGLLYANHWPYRQFATARGVRRSPLHERLADHNACFGEVAGWERANWFAPHGEVPAYAYSFGRQNWFEASAAEHRAAREGVVLFDQSSFSKYLVQGRDACAALQRICTANVDVAPGRVVYTQWLNERGGIEADLTVTRLAEDRYLVVSAAAFAVRDLDWLARHIPVDAHCVVTDVTAGEAVLGLMGPGSRALLAAAGGAELSAEAFPFGTVREVELGCSLARAARISYVGELGYELYVPSDQALHVLDALLEAGSAHRLRLAGMHALDSCRLEKRFLHFGHDVAEADTPIEAGVGFACDLGKTPRFIGYDAVARAREARPVRRLVQILLADPEPVLWLHEPVLLDGETAGYLTSGAYGHSLGGAVGLGYLRHPAGVTAELLGASRIEVDVAGERVPARASLRALYDPGGERMRG